MNPEQLYHMLQRKLFQPVRVHLKDGRFYDIPIRELAVVGVTYLNIGIQAPGARPGIVDSVEMVDLEEIARIEPLATIAPISN